MLVSLMLVLELIHLS